MLTTTETQDDISLIAVLDEWPALEFDFAAVLHIDLEGVRHTMTWRRFLNLLGGLFGTENSLTRRIFRPDPDPGQPGPTNLEDSA